MAPPPDNALRAAPHETLASTDEQQAAISAAAEDWFNAQVPYYTKVNTPPANADGIFIFERPSP
jgi:hypothetical protein